MKKLKIFSLWVILVTLALVSVNCGKNLGPDPIDPKDTIHTGGSKVDTVFIEVTIIVPECARISEANVSVIGDCLPGGGLGKYIKNTNVCLFVVADQTVIGKEVFCNIQPAGSCNGVPVSFDRITDQSKKFTLVKGMNKVAYEYTYH